MGFFLLDEYYFKADEILVHSAALMLHQSKRLKSLCQNWQSDWQIGSLGKDELRCSPALGLLCCNLQLYGHGGDHDMY